MLGEGVERAGVTDDGTPSPRTTTTTGDDVVGATRRLGRHKGSIPNGSGVTIEGAFSNGRRQVDTVGARSWKALGWFYRVGVAINHMASP